MMNARWLLQAQVRMIFGAHVVCAHARQVVLVFPGPTNADALRPPSSAELAFVQLKGVRDKTSCSVGQLEGS
jgi:hypothetical protein